MVMNTISMKSINTPMFDGEKTTRLVRRYRPVQVRAPFFFGALATAARHRRGKTNEGSASRSW